MSGPALNPIASIAPAAPPKGLDASNQDLSAQSEPDKAGSGFASELQRQMKGTPPPDEGQSAKSTSDTDADAAARAEANAQAQAPTQPELAALLGGLLPATALPAADLPIATTPPAIPPSSAETEEQLIPTISTYLLPPQNSDLPPAEPTPDAAGDDVIAQPPTDASALSGGALFAPILRTPEAIARTTGGNAELQTAERAADTTANLAGTPGKTENISLQGDPTAAADTFLRTAETSVPPPPTNNFAAIHAAALANLQGSTSPTAPAPVPMHVATPAGSPGWPEEVGNRVSWMVGQAESHAELTLTPPQLGKVEVSITVSGDQTSAQFVAATPAARDLIEQSLPRLREILEQSGINLGQADVGTSGQPGDPERGPRGSQWKGGGNTDEGLVANAASAQWARRGEGLVDTFA